MKDKTILTAESVTAGHPDKLCDTIADTVVDCCLEHDPNARVACEVLATAGKFVVAGEITALTIPDIPSIVRDTVRRAGYNCRNFDVEVLIRPQSPDIAGAVQHGEQTAAGDQGIVYGYACSETENLLPLPVVLAHRLTALLTCARTMGRISGLRPDGKAQVSVEYAFGAPRRISAIVLSCQHAEDKELPRLREELLEFVIQPALRIFPADEDTEILINPSGRFVLGGIEADTGLTGRKLMVTPTVGWPPTAAARCPARMGPRWTAAAPTWPAASPRILWPPASRRNARSPWPMPSDGLIRWLWMWIPTSPVHTRTNCWNRRSAVSLTSRPRE